MLRHAITSPARRLRLSQNRSKTVTTFTQRCLYSSNNHNDDNNPSSSPAANKPPPSPQTSYEGLPAPGEGTRITLDVSREGGSTVKLDGIGPLVVNVDGTVARIANWGEMTEPERETTLRMVGKRNKQRLAALEAKKKDTDNNSKLTTKNE